MPTSLKWIMPDDYEWLVAYELDEQNFNDLASASELEVKVAGESFTLVKDFKEPGGVMDPVLTHTYVTPEGSSRILSVAVILDRRKLTATFNKTTDSVSPSASADGKRASQRCQRPSTRVVWVCCSMTSEIHISYGSRVRRHGRSR